jgi:CBS domain-containing protein
MSPRAAWRLEAMGFEQVYDYEDGKRDWGSFGLPREGTKAQEPSGGDLARRDVPTCRLNDELEEVRRRVREAGWDTCMVVNEQGIVLGRLGRKALRSETPQAVEEAMTEGPSTVRPSIGGRAVLDRMRDNNLDSFVVTTADGKLVGVVLREEAEATLAYK